MKEILEYKLASSQAALWWLGQAGYVIRSQEITVVIDPYLSDSAASEMKEFSRLYPPPIDPAELSADIIIITHNHADHLDPDTLRLYNKKRDTWFVAPYLAAKELPKYDIPTDKIIIVNAGETKKIGDHEITGVFALPTGADVLDTTGYVVTFANEKTVYHTSDTQFHPLVFDAAPEKPDVMLVPINGKWKNFGPEQAAAFAGAVQPLFVFPNHYDMMALNSENPEVFKWFCTNSGFKGKCIIAEVMKPFVW